MNITFFARLLFSIMVACMLISFSVVAQDKPKEEPKKEMAAPAKKEMKEKKGMKEKKHHKKGMKGKKGEKKEAAPAK